jgi:pyrroline-5-carboxylate reductase
MWTDKLAFIGAGNIAEVMIDRLVSIGSLAPSQIFACDIRADRRSYLRHRFRGVHTSEDPREAAEFARMVIIATPPEAVLPVMNEIRHSLTRHHMVVSLATAVSLAKLEQVAGETPVVRALVNTPSLVGEGMNLVAFGSKVTPVQHDSIISLLGLFGRKFEVTDEQMDFWLSICGAGPMYVLPMIEVLAKAAMAKGISHEQAIIGASQVVLGAARMVQQTGKDPEELEKLSAGLRAPLDEKTHNLYITAYEEAVRKLREAMVPVST